MRTMKVPACLGPLSLGRFHDERTPEVRKRRFPSTMTTRKARHGKVGLALAMLLIVSMVSTPALHAQAPAAGASVAVRMIEAIDSSRDPAGKQYRASVTNAVDAGNGAMIPQGAAALVTLVNSGNGSGWTTQLVSVSINGQPAAVASSPASVASAAQNAASSAVSAVGSMLSGFGHHVKPATGVTAIAMGQRVVLPPGATLTFVLTQPPAAPASAAPGAPPPPSSQPMLASAASPPAPPANSVAAGTPGQNWWMCSFRDVKNPYKPALGSRMYYALVPSSNATAPARIGTHFTGYVRQNYKVTDNATAGAVGYGGCERFSNDPATRANSLDMLQKQWATSNIEGIPVAWSNTPAENAAIDAKLAGAASAAATASATLTAAANQNYAWCSSEWAGTAGTMMPAGTVMYFSDVFPITPPPQPTQKAGNGSAQIAAQSLASTPFSAFLQKQYGYKNGVRCAVTYPPTLAGLQNAQKYKQEFEDLARHNNGQVVETGWKNQ